MRKLAVPEFVLAASVTAGSLLACGEKLVLPALSSHFDQIDARSHSVSILAYTPEHSAVPSVVSDLELQPAMKQAGYTLNSVETLGKLDQALKNGAYDLVLVDVADAESLESHVRSAPSNPLVVPVVSKANKKEVATAEKRFHGVLKAPDSPKNYVSALDSAMDARSRSRPRKPTP